MTLTFYFFFLGMQRSAFFWPAGLAFGAALLTKGSVAFFSAFIALAYILFTRQWNLFKKFPFGAGFYWPSSLHCLGIFINITLTLKLLAPIIWATISDGF
jgi:hypothetical protein